MSECEVLPPELPSHLRSADCAWKNWGAGGHLMGTLGGRLQLHVSGAGERGGLGGTLHPIPVWMCAPSPSPGHPLSLAHIALPHSEPLAPVSPVGLFECVRSIHDDPLLTGGQARVHLCPRRPCQGAAASAQSLQTPAAADEERRQPSADSLLDWPKEALDQG